jgi:two-component system, OmpR family, sensor histidine kinase KdpD
VIAGQGRWALNVITAVNIQHLESLHHIVKQLIGVVNLAGDLAAEFAWLKSEDIVGAIVAFAQEKNISKIMMGRSPRSMLSRLLRRATPERFIREARGFDVEVLSDES